MTKPAQYAAACVLAALALVLGALMSLPAGRPPEAPASATAESSHRRAVDALSPPADGAPGAPQRITAEEPAGASPREGREAVEGPAAPAGTVLRVAVVDAAGRPVTEGELVCLWSLLPGVESQADRCSRIVVPIAGAVTELSVPYPGLEAWVTAYGPSSSPGSALASDLRREGVEWLEEDVRVVRDLLIQVGVRPDWPTVAGSITVDGEPRVPRGLTIRLDQDDSGIFDALDVPAPGVGRVQRRTASYVVGPVERDAHGLWVTSAETVPLWVPFTDEVDGHRTGVDLDCRTGRELILDLVDEGTGEGLAGWVLEAWLEVMYDREALATRLAFQRVTTDGGGRARFGGLPAEGRLTIRRVEGDRARGTLFTLDLAELEGERTERRVAVRGGADRELAAVWGLLPVREEGRSGAGGGAVEVVFSRVGSDGLPRIERTVRAAGDRWEVHLRAGNYVAWAEVEGRRLTEKATFDVMAGATLGPVELVAPPRRDLRLRWGDAPPNATLVVRVAGEAGEMSAPRSVPLTRRDGTLTVSVGGGTRLELALEQAGGSVVHRSLLVPSSAEELCVDLGGSRARFVELIENGARSVGPGRVVLVALDEVDGARLSANLVLVDGRTSRAVALPAATYYFARRARGEAVVCGTTRVSQGGVGSWHSISWNGERVRPAELLRPSATGIEILRCDGIDLTRVLSPDLRRFPVGGVCDSDRTLLFARGTCEWQAY